MGINPGNTHLPQQLQELSWIHQGELHDIHQFLLKIISSMIKLNKHKILGGILNTAHDNFQSFITVAGNN